MHPPRTAPADGRDDAVGDLAVEKRAARFSPGMAPALVLAAVALAGFALTGLRPAGTPLTVVVRSLAYATACLAALSLVGARYGRGWGLTQLRVGPVYLVWSAVTIGLATIGWRYSPSGRQSVIARSSIEAALSVAALALVAWTVGYLAGPGRTASRLASRLAAAAVPGRGGRLRWQAVPWLLCGAAVVARLTQIAMGQYAYLGDATGLVSGSTWFAQPLRILSDLGTVAVVVAAVDLAARPSPGRWCGFATLVAVEFGFATVSGMREQFILLAAAALVAFAVIRPWWAVVGAVAAAVVFVFAVVPFNAAYREVVRSHERVLSPQDAIRAAPGTFVDAVARPTSSADTVSSSVDALADRLLHIGSIAIVVQLTPEVVPYRDLDEVVFAPLLSVVPRAVWPGKPILAEGYRFGKEYYGLPEGVLTADAIAPQADLYRHGGLAVVVVGMAVLGAACRVVDDRVHPAGDPRRLVLYLPLLVALVKSESGMVQLAATIPTQLIVLVLLSRFVYRQDVPGELGQFHGQSRLHTASKE